MSPIAPILAHQGGWDELLLVLTPLLLVGGLLWIANRRVDQQLEGAGPAGPGEGSAAPATDPEPGES